MKIFFRNKKYVDADTILNGDLKNFIENGQLDPEIVEDEFRKNGAEVTQTKVGFIYNIKNKK